MAHPDLEISLHRRDVYRYSVDLRYISPRADADDWVSSEVRFDFDRLRETSLDDEAYGRVLSQSLFADAELRSRFAKVWGATEAGDEALRLRLFIGPSAPELHTLRWERLVDLETGAPLLGRPDVRFSRYLASRRWRSVRLQPREKLRVLVAVANPAELEEYKLAPIDVDAELRQVEAGLGDVKLTRLSAPGEASLDTILERVREGADVLYLVCHGRFDPREGQPWIFLDDGHGAVERVDGLRFARKLEALPQPPRLVVLVSCDSSGQESDSETAAGEELVALGPRLSAAGIPAVVAMHGKLTVESGRLFLSSFFESLGKDGEIDHAMKTARTRLLQADRPDWWRPVLFLRLRSGRLWYARGIAGDGEDPGGLDKWEALLTNVENGTCTPILGPGVAEYVLGTRREIARRWAKSEHFPMSPNDVENLPQVAEYLLTRHDANYLRTKLDRYLRGEMRACYREVLASAVYDYLQEEDLAGEELRESLTILLEEMPLHEQISVVGQRRMEEDPAEPHRFLASLPLKIYVNANIGHDLMADALRRPELRKRPRVELYRWHDRATTDWPPSVFEDEDQRWRPSVREPLVYHLFGQLAEPETVVLSEDDYLDYLIGLDSKKNQFPKVVNRALIGSALLFLGFRINDWSFRVLFRSIINREGRDFRGSYSHVAVQLDPEEDHTLEPESARDYVRHYFRNAANISLYAGTTQDFLSDLKEKWDARPKGGRR